MSNRKQLPDGWRWTTFGKVARQVSESTRDPLEDGFDLYVGLEHLDPDSLSIKRWGLIEEDSPSFTKVFRAGQLLFGRRRAYQRKAAIADFDGICSGDIIVMEAKPEQLLPDLLPFIVQSEGFWDYAIHTSAGSLSPRTKWSHLARYELPLPPMDEQRRIAEILWALEETIEEFLAVLTSTEEVKKAVAHDRFEALPTDDLTLEQVGDWLSGGTPSRKCDAYWQGEIPWASPKDMKSDLLLDTEEHISEEGAQSGSRILPTNSILFVTRGLILAHSFPVAMTGTEMAFNQDIKAIVAYDHFDPKFIFYWLQHYTPKILRLITDTSHGTKRLATDILARMAFPDVSNERQRVIVEELARLDKQMASCQEHISTLQLLKKNLLHELLNREVISV